MHYLIVYNIASPKRLQKIHKHLTENAIPLQNSTFLFTASRDRFEALREIFISGDWG